MSEQQEQGTPTDAAERVGSGTAAAPPPAPAAPAAAAVKAG